MEIFRTRSSANYYRASIDPNMLKHFLQTATSLSLSLTHTHARARTHTHTHTHKILSHELQVYSYDEIKTHTHPHYRSAAVNAWGLKWGVISFQSKALPTPSANVSNMALSADGSFVEICTLLGYYAASSGNSLPTFI